MTENIGTYTLTDEDIQEAYEPVLESKSLRINWSSNTRNLLKKLQYFTELADKLGVESIEMLDGSFEGATFVFTYEVPPNASVVKRRFENILKRKALQSRLYGVTN